MLARRGWRRSAGICWSIAAGQGCSPVGQERRETQQSEACRAGSRQVRGRRSGATTAMRQAVWMDVIEHVSGLLSEDRDLMAILGDVARSILDGFGLRAVAIGIVDGPWIEYRGIATEHHSIAHRVQLHASPSELTGTPFPTELVVRGELEEEEDPHHALTPLIRIPIRTGQRIAAALIVEIDQAQELDVDDIDALTRIAQIIGHGLARGASDPWPSVTTAMRRPTQEQLDNLSGLSAVTPEHLARWASEIGAVALRVVIDDWSGTWVVTGLRDGSQVSEPALTRLLAVPEVRLARASQEIQRVTDLAESLEYDAASENADVAVVAPILVGDALAGVVIAEYLSDAAQPSVGRVAESIARLIEQQRERFNRLRAEQFIHVLDRVGHVNTLGLGRDEAFEALASVVHEVLGLDAGYGVIRDGRLHFLAPQREAPIPAWFYDGIPLELGITGRVALTGREAFIRDVQETPEYLDLGDGALSEFCLPVYSSGDVVGVFNVESTVRRLDELDAQLLTSAFGMIDAALVTDDHELAEDAPPDVHAADTVPVEARGVTIDPVVGVPDEGYFSQRLAERLAVVRETGVPASVLIADVAWGEDGKEEPEARAVVMREVSQRLVDQLRGEDLVAVFGERRFAVLLPGVSAGASIAIGKRLMDAIVDWPLRLSHEANVNARCSIGIATTAIGEESPADLLANALLALEHVSENVPPAVGHYRDIEFTSGDGRSDGK